MDYFDLNISETTVKCPLCAEIFPLDQEDNPIEEHLLEQHKLIISKIDEIADLRQ